MTGSLTVQYKKWEICQCSKTSLYFTLICGTLQRQVPDFPKGGGGHGLSWVWIFHTWTFCSGTYHAVHGQNVGGQNTGGQNAKLAREDKMLAILLDREGKMAIFSQ